MATELEITFDGDTEALRQHRLSVREFGRALSALLAALQRTVTTMTNQSTKEGRFTKRASQVDLELRDLTKSSAKVAFVITEPQEPLIEDAAISTASAAARLLDDIQAESRGEARSQAARRYLSALPGNLKVQSYRLTSNGTVLRTIALSSITLAEVEPGLPSVKTLIGQVSRIGFPPALYTVGITTEDEKTMECEASQQQVEAALKLRDRTVFASVVTHENRSRLVALREDPFTVPPEDDRLRRLSDHWNETLQLLAR